MFYKTAAGTICTGGSFICYSLSKSGGSSDKDRIL